MSDSTQAATASASHEARASDVIVDYAAPSAGAVVARAFAWVNIAVLLALLINNVLTFWLGWPGASLSGGGLAVAQVGLYVVAAALAIAGVAATPRRALRRDGRAIAGGTAFFIRACFWIVLIVGVGDTIVSFLRVEELLDDAAVGLGLDVMLGMTGDEIASALGRTNIRGTYFHAPLMVVGVLIACVTRTLGFIWLALLVVAAELIIVIGRFIFSYEQAFMGDLVRFWYAALFLFASAYTLIEEGHVRVDVLYAGFKETTRGAVNAFGSIVLGMSLCWVVLVIGMSSSSGTINGPLLAFEISQSGFGLYTKYMLAGFLAVFAISMLTQFCAYLLEGVADYRGEPGKYRPTPMDSH